MTAASWAAGVPRANPCASEPALALRPLPITYDGPLITSVPGTVVAGFRSGVVEWDLTGRLRGVRALAGTWQPVFAAGSVTLTSECSGGVGVWSDTRRESILTAHQGGRGDTTCQALRGGIVHLALDGDRALSIGSDGTVVASDVASGQPVARHECPAEPRHAALGPDGTLAVADDEGVALLDPALELVRRLPQRSSAMGFSPDGSRLVLARAESLVEVHLATGRSQERRWTGPRVGRLAVGPEDQLILTTSDGVLRVTPDETVNLTGAEDIWRDAVPTSDGVLCVAARGGISLRDDSGAVLQSFEAPAADPWS